jgi:acyl dehydratase
VAEPALRATLRFEDVSVGDELPPLEVPITATAIIAGAIASRDFQDVHHDRDLARARGSRDIFMNILTTNGYVGRFVTDWAGPEALLRRVDIRLGVPNYPGDTMRITGRVREKRDGEVTVDVRGANRLGDHVTGSVTLTLPGAAGA